MYVWGYLGHETIRYMGPFITWDVLWRGTSLDEEDYSGQEPFVTGTIGYMEPFMKGTIGDRHLAWLGPFVTWDDLPPQQKPMQVIKIWNCGTNIKTGLTIYSVEVYLVFIVLIIKTHRFRETSLYVHL